MTIDKVIELGGKIQEPGFPWHEIYELKYMIIFGVFIFLVFIGEPNYRPYSFTLLVFIIIVGAFSYYSKKNEEVYVEQLNKWENEVGVPFIESLPKEKHEILYIEIHSELDYTTRDPFLWEEGYTKEIGEQIPMIISFQDETLINEKDYYEVSLSLGQGEKPYIEYQELEEYLGHGFYEGRYNEKIYLPEDYEITTIK